VVKYLCSLNILEIAKLFKDLLEIVGCVKECAEAVDSLGLSNASLDIEKEINDKYDIYLTEAGSNKIAVILEFRKALSELGLAEAECLVQSAPKILKHAISKVDAQILAAKLDACGAKTVILEAGQTYT
jgi:ribosomal protein L7/L12